MYNAVGLAEMDSGTGNGTQIEYLREQVRAGDVFIYADIGAGSAVAVHFEDDTQYSYHPEGWGVEQVYPACAPQMQVLTDLSFPDGCMGTGRIWLVDSPGFSLYYGAFGGAGYQILQIKEIGTAYQNYTFSFALVEKE